jgi:aryl-alcohol dehydrogenase-like predicted oxidoreductase
MKYRILGRTGFRVSEIGAGTWGIGGDGWGKTDDRESINALNLAIDLGLNFIDTAPGYGNGHSERLIGEVLKTRSEKIYVATKIPPKNGIWPARKGSRLREAFPRNHIIECTEQSLRNLDVDTIDLQQFHVWQDDWASDPEWQEAVVTLKDQGKVRAVGISTNDHEPCNGIAAVKTKKIDVLQVIFNMFDQSPTDELLPLCEKESIGIIARVPFDEGGLTGQITEDTRFEAGDWRDKYFRGERKLQVSERVEKLKKLLGREANTLPELALRYILSFPTVSTVIPGMRKTSHVKENLRVSDGRLLSRTLLEELKTHRWDRNFYMAT